MNKEMFKLTLGGLVTWGIATIVNESTKPMRSQRGTLGRVCLGLATIGIGVFISDKVVEHLDNKIDQISSSANNAHVESEPVEV